MGTNICALSNHTIDVEQGGASILAQVAARLSINIFQRKREHKEFFPTKQWCVSLLSDNSGDWVDDPDITWLHNQSFDLRYYQSEQESDLTITIFPKLVQLYLEQSYEWTSFATDVVFDTGEKEFFGTYRNATLAAAKLLGHNNVLYMGDKLMNQIFDWDYKDTVETLVERGKAEHLVIWDIATKTAISGTVPDNLSEYDHAFHQFMLIEDVRLLSHSQ